MTWMFNVGMSVPRLPDPDVLGVADGRIARARLYVEPVEQGEGIEAAVREMTGQS